jgi:hypothetical protein
VAAAEKPVEADPVVFWGKEVGGLQAGLSLVETKTERAGDTAKLAVKMEVKVRNVGTAPATITYGSPWERSPTITDPAGKEVPVRHSDFWIAPILLPRSRVIEPGKTFSLSHPEITLEVDANQPVPENIPERTVRVRPGAYTISYDWVADSHKELATGGLPFKVMDPGRVTKADREDDKVAWGEEVDGLRAGLSLVEMPRVERAGGSARREVRFRLHIRNVGNAPVTITYGAPREDRPTIADAAGDAVRVAMPPVHFGSRPNYSRVIESGRTFTLFDHELVVEVDAKQPPQTDVKVPTVRAPQGKYTVSYSGMVSSHKKLATGRLPFDLMGPGNDAKADLEDGRAAESTIAWGKEVGGLQAGLSIRSGGENASETSTLVVRVRNVGKETVKFSHLLPFEEHAFTVTDGEGKPVPQPKILPDIGERTPGVVELAPGKEIVLHEFNRRFLPAGKAGGDDAWKKPYTLYYGAGKIGIRYDQVFGSPEMGVPGWKLDPGLSTLATGTLETEVIDTGDDAEDRALATATKLGGRYERKGKEAAGPVVLISIGNTKVADADLKALAALTDVETLNLSCTGVTDAGLRELAPLKNLKTLYLGNVPITDRGLRELAGFKKLTALYVESAKITDAGLKELAALPALEKLHLGGPLITDAGIEHLAPLRGLKVLSVRRTAITPAGVKALRGALPTCAVTD